LALRLALRLALWVHLLLLLRGIGLRGPLLLLLLLGVGLWRRGRVWVVCEWLWLRVGLRGQLGRCCVRIVWLLLLMHYGGLDWDLLCRQGWRGSLDYVDGLGGRLHVHLLRGLWRGAMVRHCRLCFDDLLGLLRTGAIIQCHFDVESA